MKISLLCPTRGRPNQMETLWFSAYNTAKEKDKLSIIFRIDLDDVESFKKVEELCKVYPKQIYFRIAERHPSLGKLTNECLELLNDQEILHMSGDDLIFRTESWDEHVRKVFLRYNDRLCLAYASDLYISDNQRFGTHPFIHRKHVDILGYAVRKEFVGSYLDTALNRTYDIINRKFKLPVIIEHMHGAAGKGVYDNTMLEKFDRERQQNSGGLFYDLLPQICDDAKKLYNHISQKV